MDENKNVRDLRQAEPYDIAANIVRILDGKKARGLKLLHVEEQSSITSYIVLCSGDSNTQIRSLASEVEYVMSLCGQDALNTEGYAEGTWVVIDYGPVMVHIFGRDTRDFYKLEKLYGETNEMSIEGLVEE